jgi:hypothetical protein
MNGQPQKPNFLQVVSSILSAAIGVQSTENRERDFTSGSAKTYIIGGVIFTVLFVLAITTVVKLVLK